MAAGHTTTFVPTRKPIDGHLDYEQRRPHGMFSTKTKVPKSVDVFNKPVPYTMIGVPWADPAANKDRPERFKGKVRRQRLAVGTRPPATSRGSKASAVARPAGPSAASTRSQYV